MKIVVSGFKGKMGTACTNMVLRQEDFTLVAVYDPFATEKQLDELPQYAGNPVRVFRDKATLVKEVEADVWIDFSRPDAAYDNTRFALENGMRPVIGTTGFSTEQLEELTNYSKEVGLGGLIAPNFAIGAVLMMEFAAKAAKYFPDVEIMELHHENKLDAPSGTAIKTAELIYAVRGDHP
ncbi:MAG: 4-hydroxy-tetrahydrodipicolinate reductase, partial [Trichococcus flocculiformis]